MRCSRCGTELPADARFCLSCGAAVAGAVVEERKFVSVLFVDIVGSTAHADGADPEDVRDRNQLYYRRGPRPDRAARRHDREVHRRRGDGGVRGAARAERRRRAGRPGGAEHPRGHRGELNERDPGLDLQVRAAVCTGEAIVSVDAAPASPRDRRRGQHRGPSADPRHPSGAPSSARRPIDSPATRSTTGSWSDRREGQA